MSYTNPQMTNGNSLINPFKFVRTSRSGHPEEIIEPGLTKREFFAAMAMQGYLANPLVAEAFARVSDDIDVRAARCSVEAADALIDALNAEVK